MGQVALGFRSLFVKLAIFVVMAALLAWALGGTLWPKAEIVDHSVVDLDGTRYFWRLEVGGGSIRDRHPGEMRWYLMRQAADDRRPLRTHEQPWFDATSIVAEPDALYFGRRVDDATRRWDLVRYDGLVTEIVDRYPDRLAIELQLARLRRGQDAEDAAAEAARRPLRLDPPPLPGR